MPEENTPTTTENEAVAQQQACSGDDTPTSLTLTMEEELAVMDRRLKRYAQKMKSPRARMLLELAADWVRKAVIYEAAGGA